MIKSVRIKFDKFQHETFKAILIRIGIDEYWLPKKLCRNLIVNKKMGGNVCIPYFFAEKLKINEYTPDIEVIHHIPIKTDITEIKHNAELFR